jgi:16S rRNA (guanine966-N2)-methyltransferase
VKALEANGAEIVQRDAMAYLDGAADRFDVAFVDAPFASGLARHAMERLPPRLKPGARVYVESAQPLDLGAPWAALREDRAGAVRYALYELTP